MTNNDILRRLRYTFDWGDRDVIRLYEKVEQVVTRAQISDWMKPDDDEAWKSLHDKDFASLLNGLIITRRGRRDGPLPIPEKSLNNNIIFRKLRIALNLKDDDILDIMALGLMRISKHELSAFFRKPEQSQYRPCKDQILRKFLKGLQKKHRPVSDEEE